MNCLRFDLVNVTLVSLILNIITRLTVWCIWIVGLTFVRYLHAFKIRKSMVHVIHSSRIINLIKIFSEKIAVAYLRIVSILPIGSVSNDLCSSIGQLNTVFATRHITITNCFVRMLVRRSWIADCIVEGKWHSRFMMMLIYARKKSKTEILSTCSR